jgi:hypothetical protein
MTVEVSGVTHGGALPVCYGPQAAPEHPTPQAVPPLAPLGKAREPLTDEMIEAENDSIYHDASNSRDYSWKAGAAWARDHYESRR